MPEATRRTGRVAKVTTTKPEIPPPQLVCPKCEQTLIYRQTVIRGVRPRERWDYFSCRHCGQFVYRSRTLRLRRP
jgi:predicted RNA-binding Zn-ribbon protein involved in translation (DUF1610 family)